MERIRNHFVDHKKRYGSPKITRLLHQEGYTITERTVSVYMRQMKLRSIVSKPYRVQTTHSKHNHPIALNTLNQQFKVLKPNTVWVTDITYIPCRGGRLYLASVMDLCTREIVGWRLYDHMESSMSRRGNCYDNACIESWHSILKKELIYCNPRFKTKEQAYQSLFQYIEFYYNRKRMHGALGYLSPVRFAEQFTRKSVS
ncbi:IS3 family transposase [Paenibacillus sp. FSL K6-0276]|uniref:IS3 family transposase n=1 Tax=Paenibacillus sp. FSL K6-0276 TaxID=2921450 RepID=UPI0030EEE02B